MLRCSGEYQPVGIRRDQLSCFTGFKIEFFHMRRSLKTLSDAVGILKGMASELHDEYNEVEKLVQLLLVLRASSAETVRSFSSLQVENLAALHDESSASEFSCSLPRPPETPGFR